MAFSCSRQQQHPLTRCCVHVQAAYAEYLGRDDSGAIAAFLDDATTNLLQVRQQHDMIDRQCSYASCWQAVYMSWSRIRQHLVSSIIRFEWALSDHKLTVARSCRVITEFEAVLLLGCRSALPSQQMGSCKCGSQTQRTSPKLASIRCV
jgi:hypothetical protein